MGSDIYKNEGKMPAARGEANRAGPDDVLQTIIDFLPSGVTLFDPDLQMIACNEQFKQLLDFPAAIFESGLPAMSDLAIFNARRGDYGPGEPEVLAQQVVERARSMQAHVYERTRPNGTVLEIRGAPLPDGRGFVTIYTDITERKQMEEQVRQLAFYDALTNLPNRRLLSDRLRQAMAASKRNACYGALMFIDLDHFKALNDTHGHALGDLLLIEAADRLKNSVREVDTVARLGGDEFVVMLSDLHAEKTEATAQALLLAEKIRSQLAEPYRLPVSRDGQNETIVEHHCTASIGTVVFVNHEGSQDDILMWADMAMYEAKEAGRNLIRVFDPSSAARPVT